MELLLILFPGIPVILACASYLIFWYETLSGPHLDEIRRQSQGRPGRWALTALASASASQVMVIALFFLHFMQRFWLPDERRPGVPPVLLVHGLYHNSSAWALFAGRLSRRGLTDLHALGYNSYSGSYWKIVERIDKKVEDILADRPAGTRIALVGHSLGGLAIRGWLSTGKHSERALAAVTLGTPHKGSKLAGLGIGRLARSLMRHGELIAEIEKNESPPPCPALSLRTLMDNMVIPAKCLRIDTPGWTERTTPPVSHVAMLYSKSTAEEAASFIREAAGKAS